MLPSNHKLEDGTEDRLSRVTYFFFVAFLFFLPLYEAPKNIFSVLFVFLGCWVSFGRKKVAGRLKLKDPVVWVFLSLTISPFVAGLNSIELSPEDRFFSALNWALLPLSTLVLLLLAMTSTQMLGALRIGCIGSVIAVIEGLLSWSGPYPELNSVGHVNQSALYLAFCLILAGLLTFMNRGFWDYLLALTVVIAVFAFQGPARSMIGFGLSLIAVGSMLLIYLLNAGYLKQALWLISLGFVGIYAFSNIPAEYLGPYEGFKREFDVRLHGSINDPYAQRDKLYNASIEIAGGSMFGHGLGSFGEVITIENLQISVANRNASWEDEKDQFAISSHGHNLFSNLLVERGWFGVCVITLCFISLFAFFAKNKVGRPRNVGILTLMMVIIGGMGQTTLHVEHGQLALLLLGLSYRLEDDVAHN